MKCLLLLFYYYYILSFVVEITKNDIFSLFFKINTFIEYVTFFIILYYTNSKGHNDIF